VGVGDVVDLVDGEGADLGSVSVLEIDHPDDVLGIPPAAGNKIVAAKVRYEAVASWTYTLFDWALHDQSDRQYEPTGLAPDPALSGGTLAPGKNVEGWVTFEVPDGAQTWVDMTAGDGTIILSVPAGA
jgi:hypothetical protein